MDKIKKIGTREEVYKSLAQRTAGGLKHEDIIEKQFGNKFLYISKKLSDKMRINYFKRNPKRTLCSTSTTNTTNTPNTTNITNTTHTTGIDNVFKKYNAKTQKIKMNFSDNTVKNVYYPELQGINIKNLKDELAREEAEEDKGLSIIKPLTIEEMPNIDITTLDMD